MQQFAALRQAAREGEADNERVIRELAAPDPSSSNENNFDSEWDIPLYLTSNPQSRPSEPRLGSTDDERAYYNAIRTSKRGDDALIEHLEHKVAKTKRARTHEASTYAGVQISSRNVEFNERRQKQL